LASPKNASKNVSVDRSPGAVFGDHVQLVGAGVAEDVRDAPRDRHDVARGGRARVAVHREQRRAGQDVEGLNLMGMEVDRPGHCAATGLDPDVHPEALTVRVRRRLEERDGLTGDGVDHLSSGGRHGGSTLHRP